MMDTNGMVERCMDGMGSVLGGGTMVNGVILFAALLVLVVWVMGLAAVGALIFWGVGKLSRTSSANGS